MISKSTFNRYKEDSIFTTDKGILVNTDCLSFLKCLPDQSVDCIITSPPYWGLRYYETVPQYWGGDINCDHEWSDCQKLPGYGTYLGNHVTQICGKCDMWMGELGLEPLPEMFVDHLMIVFGEVKRVLKNTGCCFINIKDTYVKSNGCDVGLGSQAMIPSRFALRMVQDESWLLRNELIWHQLSVLPESVKNRFTRNFETVYFFVKQLDYCFEQQLEKAIMTKDRMKVGKRIVQRQELGLVSKKTTLNQYDGLRNPRTVFCSDIISFANTAGESGEHIATYPVRMIELFVKSGCPQHGVVLDPFMGSGTTAVVAERCEREWVGSELSVGYFDFMRERFGEFGRGLEYVFWVRDGEQYDLF